MERILIYEQVLKKYIFIKILNYPYLVKCAFKRKKKFIFSTKSYYY